MPTQILMPSGDLFLATGCRIVTRPYGTARSIELDLEVICDMQTFIACSTLKGDYATAPVVSSAEIETLRNRIADAIFAQRPKLDLRTRATLDESPL